ncbi:MAG: ABC transporter ATP-binding protein [Desulfobacterales bacterium]
MIELRGIGRKFQVGTAAVRALRDVDLTVRDGEYLSVMGPSGSGKSTLLNIIGLLDRPDEGVYRLDDVNATELSEVQQAAVRRHQIGFVFQFFHLVPRLTAAENVELPLILAGVDPAERRKRLGRALEALGIADRARHRPDQLSGGQRQRVAIARATIMQPGIILADEPTGNLDRSSGNEVIDILEGLRAEGRILIMVTHDPELGRRAERRIQMFDGRIGSDSGESA